MLYLGAIMLVLLWALCLCVSVCECIHHCANPGSSAKASAELQKLIDDALKGSYQLIITDRDVMKNKSAQVVEVRQAAAQGNAESDDVYGWQRTVANSNQQMINTQWIWRNNTIANINSTGSCNVSTNWTSYPLDPPTQQQLTDALGKDAQPWTSVRSIANMAMKSTVMWIEEPTKKMPFTIGGVFVDQWVACFNVTNSTFLEIRMHITKPGQKILYPKVDTVPLVIEVAIYAGMANVTTTDIYRHVYTLSDFKGPCPVANEKYLLPPRGVLCNGTSSEIKKMPVVADSFSMRLQYFDNNAMRIDSTTVDYSQKDSLIGFAYRQSDSDEPFSSGLAIDKPQRVVHDFKTGLQFATTMNDRTCFVSPIPLNSSDATIAGERKIKLKDPLQLLFGSEESQFVYVGKRRADTGVVCDVWIAEEALKPEAVTREAWFTIDQWKMDGHLGSIPNVPYQLVTYINNSTGVYRNSTQRFSFDEDLGQPDLFPINHWFVRPCLNLTNSSNLMIETNKFDETLLNDRSLRTSMTRKLAEVMNISVLRISRIYPKDDEGSVVLFLQVSDDFTQEGTPTVDMLEKVSLQQAILNFNQSLAKGLTIDKIKLVDGTLSFIPGKFMPGPNPPRPLINKSGYTGGSMAVLAFFMLILGGAIGVGGAFFMWKRNRGIAYQVYE